MTHPPTMTLVELWTFRDQEAWVGTDITGFKVEALDGEIGKVDEATYWSGSSYIVVDTGPWIFGKKVMLPAGVIDRIDVDSGRVFVNRTNDQIKNAPEFDEATYRESEYQSELGTYYGEGGEGYRGWVP